MALSPAAKVGIGMGAGVILVHLLPIPGLIAWILTLAILGAPVAGWFMLTPEQRRRMGRMHKRGQLGR